jgi:hypothetical protein
MVTQTADSILLILSWLFVASRFVHAYIHLTSNRIGARAPVFLVGAIGLALMWIIVAARLTIAFTDDPGLAQARQSRFWPISPSVSARRPTL